ncbi:hypothetical protein BsWGS_10776 [Bradybaena similaris]
MYTSQAETPTVSTSYAESTKYVADILSSMANGGVENSFSYLPNFLVSSVTGLTPSLTPTTVATIEQSFLELQSAQQNRVWESVAQSGFVPPVIDAGHSTEVSQDSQEYSSEYSDSEWEPSIKRGRVSQVMKDIKNVDLIVTSTGTINAAPQRKYTRRNKDEKLPPEEEEKRRVRRERNKLAAAKCRQRRVDHTNILVAETEKLEAEQSQLESEIQNLQYVKEQLEFVLQAHQPLCKVDKTNSHSEKVKIESGFGNLKSGKDQLEFLLQVRSLADKVKHEPGSCPASCDKCSSHDASGLMPENLSMSTSAGSALPNGKPASSSVSATPTSSILETSAFNSRPTSLPLIKRDRAHLLSSATGITIDTPSSGVNITPSSLFYPGLESMVDGSTGLTPLTGMSCSSQVQQNTSEGRSESESNLISL